MAEDFTRRLPYGLSDLLAPPPDDFNPLYPPNDLASMGTQRAGEAQVVPAGFRLPLRRISPTYPAQGGLAPGGGRLPEIPVPDAWKALPEILLSLNPSVLMARRLGKKVDCYKRFDDEQKECWENKDDYAHPDFLDGCLKRATARRNDCVANRGRPSSDEPLKWRAGSDKNPGDEEIYKNPDR